MKIGWSVFRVELEGRCSPVESNRSVRRPNRTRPVSDFDSDTFIGRDDLQKTVNCLTKNELTEEEVEFISDRVSVRACV